MKTKIFKTKSGETLTLLPVTQVELAPLAQKIIPLMPKPPVQVVQTANGPMEVAHETHPDYLAAQEAFAQQHGVFMSAALLELGVDIDFTPEQQAFIDRRRKKIERVFPGSPENQFDTYVYLKMICEEDELGEILKAISSINNPTAEQVQAHLDAFRPGVPGPESYEDKDAPKWNKLTEWQPDLNALPGGEVGGDRDTSLLRGIGPRVAG
jgi:hypothetical protein